MRLMPAGRLAPRTLALLLAIFVGAASSLIGTCGPFTDVAADSFCQFVLEIFYLGITTGTTPTTYDPASSVSRLQMAAFLSRSVDGVLKRGGRRAALGQFASPQNPASLGLTTVGSQPRNPVSDGADIWVPNFTGSSVSRVRGSDGRALETWTGAQNPWSALAAMGKILVTGDVFPNGRLYEIDPTQPAGSVSVVASNLGGQALGIAFDGARVWTANNQGSVSIITPAATVPWTVTTVTAGFTQPVGAVFDGSNVWVTETQNGVIFKLDPAGAILQTVTIAGAAGYPAFDGTNLWVPPALGNYVVVIRPSTGAILQTVTANGLSSPLAVAFDGERVLVTNQAANTVSVWKAAGLTPLGNFSTGASTFPTGVCSDGINFWVTLSGPGQLARF